MRPAVPAPQPTQIDMSEEHQETEQEKGLKDQKMKDLELKFRKALDRVEELEAMQRHSKGEPQTDASFATPPSGVASVKTPPGLEKIVASMMTRPFVPAQVIPPAATVATTTPSARQRSTSRTRTTTVRTAGRTCFSDGPLRLAKPTFAENQASKCTESRPTVRARVPP